MTQLKLYSYLREETQYVLSILDTEYTNQKNFLRDSLMLLNEKQ